MRRKHCLSWLVSQGSHPIDILAFLVRAQNAAVLFRKHEGVTVFKSFEVSLKAESVMTTGKLICSYPGPAIEIPNVVFEDKKFLTELANFLARMNNDVLDAAATSRKADSTVIEDRDTTHPRYITELLTGILRSVGRPADVLRITKRIGDDVVWNNSRLPWRRSSLWLLIRVAIQTSLCRSAPDHDIYKQFMLFFMCRLANDEMVADLSNDLLEFMSAKISRRLRKLGSSAPDKLSRIVLETCTSLRSILEKRWDEVQAAQRVSPPWNPSLLDLSRDIDLSLLTSGDYIRSALANRGTSPSNTRFQPAHRPRGPLEDFLSPDEAFFEEAYDAEPYVALYDVEHAVEQDIDAWVDRVMDRDDACEKLELLADEYSTSALKTYRGNPELLSIMLLTTIELWVALDKLAILETPMLEEYSPEVPVSLLERLSLSKTGNLLRLQRVYNYLSRRHSQSHSGWSNFSSSITANSFAVRFYRKSSDLQHLKSRIEEAARRDVSEKISELDRKNARYAELKQDAAQLDHDYDGLDHAPYCQKCSLVDKCRNMRITVNEWPLPAAQLDAEAVTFELDCPVSFNMWRSATSHLLVDLCSPSVETKDPYILLPDYKALQPYLSQHPRSRITLASDAKPFVDTHYREARIPTTQHCVCLNNGLKLYGFDSHARIPLAAVSGPCNIGQYCTYELPCGPYKTLQKYVDTTSHTSNGVLANQADCHQSISIHEYISFGHVRSGDLLQWPNILRELRGRSLTFRRHEIHFLFAQATSQVGPLEDAGWKWHRDLQRLPFCEALLGELEGLVRDVEGNWLEAVTMDTISFLLRRLLASNPNEVVSSKALELLRIARSKVFLWVEELSAKLTQTPGDEEFRGFLRDAAAICRSTFNVDPSVVQPLLDSPEDIAIFLFCAVLVHDHTPSDVSSLPAHSRLLLDRDRRLSLALESVISDVIQADSTDKGIDLAVGWVWSDYRPGSKWYPLQSPNSRWFWCNTASTTDQSSQEVHFNILDGSLLVNGRPLGRLPSKILRHPLYNLIFGKQVLDVTPSNLPGMDYSTRSTISDHQAYFSLRNDSNLVIKTKEKSTSDDIMELIPPEKLKGDLPAVLIEGHAHWLNLSTAIMEIRPLNSLWKGSPDDWKMYCTLGQYRVQDLKGDKYLVDIHSQSWSMVSRLLRPLDAPQNHLVCVSPIDCNQSLSSMQLTVSLPRYTSGLSFFVDEDGDLQSRNIRDMVYDEDQSIGTLFGLVNRLILRSKNRYPHAVELTPRFILIPDGKISFQKEDHHVRIEVSTPDSALERITYQTYKVDADLGCLTGNVSLTNKLYRVYLHALTSGCGPDPLTGRTGTEEALSLLRSASCSSIMRFSSREAGLLGLIASICPARDWYPKRLRCMQVVEWHDLPTSTQHHELYVASQAIKEHYERVQPFLENQSSPLFQTFPVRDYHLLERSALRAAYLFPSELSGCSSAMDHDIWYSSRDLVDAGEQRAYIAATSVHYRTAYSITRKDILGMMESWRQRSVSGTASLSPKYDSSWLSPNLPRVWLKAYHRLFRRLDDGKWFQLLFSLPAMAYASPKLSDLVPVFIAFAQDPRFQREDPPPYESYELKDEYRPSEEILRRYISNRALSFKDSPESSLQAWSGERSYDLRKRQREQYGDRLDSDITATVERLMDAWPCETPPRCRLDSSLYCISDLTSDIQRHFSSCYRNLKLNEHIIRVQDILDSIYAQSLPIPTPQYSFQPSSNISPRASWSITLDQLFARPETVPSLQVAPARLPQAPCTLSDRSATLSESALLDKLLDTVEANAKETFQHRYVSNLRESAQCFRTDDACLVRREMNLPTARTLEEWYVRCRDDYVKGLNHVKLYFTPRSQSEQALAQSDQWPRITAHTLFRSLASNSPIVLSDGWKGCLVQLALLALELQRARRLLRLHHGRNDLPDELHRELQSKGCDGWDAETHPDWLLIQLQNNFLVRRVQAEVADEMIAPRSGSNTAMQLNMGEGKSSVIVPIVVAALADGTQPVRVIVPKALTAQMFNLLVDRLGGLVNRRIYLLPFSRSLGVDDQKAASLQNMMAECMAQGGILVVQPEHILSLRLVSVEKQLQNEEQTHLAGTLLEIQKWLHSHSRDILDESDEILHVRYQLVYTIGNQTAMEGFPERWTTTQQVLALVCKHASSLQELFPHGVDYQSGPPGSFPHLRILHEKAGQELISRVVHDVIDSQLDNFNFGQLCSGYKAAIRSFISCGNVPPAEVQLVKDYCLQTSRRGGLLLLRGLFATGILLFALRDRRWRVDYGLAPPRTMLAVPYRAKDVPAQRAEFGHPDVAILLTCLSYYYGGLSEGELMLSFEILLSQADPSLEYNLWIENHPDVPEFLRTLNGINIQSSEQWDNYLHPLFNRNRATVDFYLSNVVFPKEAKEFPSKLSCSGWDLAERKECLLTGFSGTNDGQYLLPLHIAQRDPDHQRGTNAKVLSYLLQPENKEYMCMTHENGERRTTREFLEILVRQRPEIRVLLDVGAQMLDLENRDLARTWLDINTAASAAIYFSKDDELMVLTRDGEQPFISSPFAQQLDECVLYLDDAHTRGTDIKFPRGFRAAVTLGPKVTKDRLAQGCMRMRKLGHGHSLMFFAPFEIDRRIRSVAQKGPLDVIDTMDILQWVIRETCDDIQQRAPHWAQQGMDHSSRYSVWTEFCSDMLSSDDLSDAWLQPEAKKLEELYGPHASSNSTFKLVAHPDIHQHCVKLGVLSLLDVSMDEEQEREVVHEAEREQQVERPPRLPPAIHLVHPDVEAFVKTGFIPFTSKGFRRVTDTLDVTSAVANEPQIWSPCVLATADFEKTVKSSKLVHDYLRPVMWVASGKRGHHEALVILSPYEVNELLPYIRSNDKIHLHLYTPRVTKSMKPCDDLALHNIPTVPTGWIPDSSLVDQLNIFAGQLYLKDYEAYIRLCRFLCVYARDLEDEDINVDCDGFISPNSRPNQLSNVYTFQTSPLRSVKRLMGLRRKGMGFALTHMGKLLDGRLLDGEDFQI